MAVTVSDVESLSTDEWQHLDQGKKSDLLDDAKAERDTIYSERMSTLPTIEGDEEVFLKNLAAHKWTLAEGGSAQSESSQGGSVNYNNTGQIERYLDLTRYGETCKAHLRSEQSFGFVVS